MFFVYVVYLWNTLEYFKAGGDWCQRKKNKYQLMDFSQCEFVHSCFLTGQCELWVIQTELHEPRLIQTELTEKNFLLCRQLPNHCFPTNNHKLRSHWEWLKAGRNIDSCEHGWTWEGLEAEYYMLLLELASAKTTHRTKKVTTWKFYSHYARKLSAATVWMLPMWCTLRTSVWWTLGSLWSRYVVII